MASIHGTVSTIFAVQISAPCSPCMNWLRLQFWDSIACWSHSLSVHDASEVPDRSKPSCSTSSVVMRMGDSAAMRSWSTSMDQSRSVSPFHCECLAFS